MKSRKNLAIVLLLTIVAAVAFASPASATGFISGLVKYDNGTLAGGVMVIATNNSNTSQIFTAVSGSTPGTNLGSYVVNIPSGFLPSNFMVTANATGFIASAVSSLNVTDANTTVAQDLVLTEILYPTTKVDTVSLFSIPADNVSTTVITATVLDQHGNPLAYGDTHNSSLPQANVSFYLRNGSLDVTTGDNGTLIGQAINITLDQFGKASVTLKSGLNAGTVTIFNNVSIPNANGKEVNKSVVITFAPLTGDITGEVRDSNNNLVSGANVTAKRFYIYWNITNGSVISYGYEPIPSDALGNPLVSISNPDYTLARVPLKFNNFNATTGIGYQYEFYNNLSIGNFTPPLGTSLTNYILVTGNKSGYNDGIMKTFLEAQTTAPGNDIVLSTVPTVVNGIIVQADNTTHQQLNQASIKVFSSTTSWQITAYLNTTTGAPVVGRNVTFTVDNSSIAAFAGGSNTGYALTGADGIARITVYSNTSPGIATVTGTYGGFTDYDLIQAAGVGQISGDVADENHATLPGATVKLWTWNGTAYVYPSVNVNGVNIADVITNIPSASPPSGHYTFVNVLSGQYKITADIPTTSGTKSGFAVTDVPNTGGTVTADIVVTLAGAIPIGSLTAITVSPTSATLNVSQNQTFTATGTDVVNNPVTITPAPTWASSNTSVGTITSGGVFTAVAPGTTTVTATSGAISSAGVTVTVQSSAGLVDSYLPPGGTAAQWKAGIIRAMDDYFTNGLLTKAQLISILDAYFA